MYQLAKNPFVRKGLAQLRRVPRQYRAWTASPDDYRSGPPVLCNSFPKSGTHLLLQVAEALPGVVHYGSFLASVPSIKFRLRSKASTVRLLQMIAPHECLGSHLYYDPLYADTLNERNIAHLFIYRDPRDVVVSEAHYLMQSAWWHGMHKRFKLCDSQEARLRLSIEGLPHELPDEYPNIRGRFERYQGWLNSPHVCCVRFEDLVGENQRKTVRKIVNFYCQLAGGDSNRESAVEQALAAIEPSKSHTFRRGKAEAWREEFTPELKELFQRVSGDLVVRLGYEPTPNW